MSDTFRQARRLLVAYWLYAGAGSLLLSAALLATRRTSLRSTTRGEVLLVLVACLVGLAAGQWLALLRLRAFPVFISCAFAWASSQLVLAIVLGFQHPFARPLTFGAVWLLSGFFSLRPRLALVAYFCGAAGWIGAAVVILNAHHERLRVWRLIRQAGWLPWTLLLLAGFLVTLLVYLVARQGYRLSLWQSLAGDEPPPGWGEAPRGPLLAPRNCIPLLVLGGLLFAFTAGVSPHKH